MLFRSVSQSRYDGKILCGGGFTSFNGTGRNYVCRLNSTGSLDTGFNPGTGISTSVVGPILSIKELASGDVMIGGAFNGYNGNTVYGAVGYEGDIVTRPDKPVGCMHRVSNNELMLSFYQPRITLEEGIQMAVKGIV